MLSTRCIGYVFQPVEKLALITQYLRSTHCYCVWCGTTYNGLLISRLFMPIFCPWPRPCEIEFVSINDTDLSVLWRPVAAWYRCCRHGVKLSGRLFRRSLTWSHHLTSSRPISPHDWHQNTMSSGWHSQYTADGLFSSAGNTNGSIVFVMQSCDVYTEQHGGTRYQFHGHEMQQLIEDSQFDIISW